MPRISIDDSQTNVIPPVEPLPPVDIPVPDGRDPRFPHEPTTDEELRAKSGSPVMAAFCAYPTGVHFAGEHEEENIILLLRAHLITNVPWIIISFILALIPTVVFPFLFATGFIPTKVGTDIVVAIFWYLGVFTYAFLHALYWYFNVGIVTNERIIDVDWNSLTYHDVATALISHIEDVKENQVGVLSGIFDFGNVFVQTAGNEINVEFLQVPHPQLVVRKIQELMGKEENEHEHWFYYQPVSIPTFI